MARKGEVTITREAERAMMRLSIRKSQRIAELEAALRTVRAAIVEKAEDTFWLTPIETVVDHIDAVLGEYAGDQTELFTKA